MSEDWPYPDHYVLLDCPDCDEKLATAKRGIDRALCVHCSKDLTEENVEEYGPRWDE
jgi:hypothetical protein